MDTHRQSTCLLCRGLSTLATLGYGPSKTNNLSDAETSAAFRTFCKLFDVDLSESTLQFMWNFELEPLPICQNCSPVFHELVQLSEKLQQIKSSIQAGMNSVRQKIAKSYQAAKSLECHDDKFSSESDNINMDFRVESFQRMILNELDIPEAGCDSDPPNSSQSSINNLAVDTSFPGRSQFFESPECQVKIEVEDETILTQHQSEDWAPDIEEEAESTHPREAFRRKRAAYLLRRFNKRTDLLPADASKLRFSVSDSKCKGIPKADTIVKSAIPRRKCKRKASSKILTRRLNQMRGASGPSLEKKEKVPIHDRNYDDSDDYSYSDIDLEKPPRKRKKQIQKSLKKKKMKSSKSVAAVLTKCTVVDGKYFYKDVEILRNEDMGPGYYKCSLCSVALKCTKVGTAVYDHIDISHNGNYPFKCDQCFKGYNRRYKLEGHIQSEHMGQHVFCDICEKPLKNRQSLSAHKKLHRGQKEIEAEAAAGSHGRKPRQSYHFQCPKCGLIFRSNWALTMHDDLVHMGKLLKCTAEGCKETFKSTSTRHEHLRKVHADVKRNYECGECQKLFLNASTLKTHMIRHSVGPKPFRCSFCSSEYTRQFALRTHILQVHSDPKDYQCHPCGTSYTRFITFQRHLKKHHPNQDSSSSDAWKTFHANKNLLVL